MLPIWRVQEQQETARLRAELARSQEQLGTERARHEREAAALRGVAAQHEQEVLKVVEAAASAQRASEARVRQLEQRQRRARVEPATILFEELELELELVKDRRGMPVVIGRGGGGAVYLAFVKATGVAVAVKLIEDFGATPKMIKAEAQHEHSVAVKSPFALQVIATLSDEKGVVVELCLGDVASWIHGQLQAQDRKTPLPPSVEQLATVVAHLLSAVHTMHVGLGLAHGDLKPANMLVVREAAEEPDEIPAQAGRLRLIVQSEARPRLVGPGPHLGPHQQLQRLRHRRHRRLHGP